MARPTKLTGALLTKLDAIADDGRSLADVCTHLEISQNTWRSWESASGDDALHAEFLSMAARVRARANTGMLDKCDGIILAALNAQDVPAAKKAELAIQYKRLVGTQRVELTGKDGGPVTVDVSGAKDLLMAGLTRLKPKPDDDATA